MKILIILLAFFSFAGIKKMSYEPYTETGHDQFESFEIPNGRRILISYTNNELKRKYKEVPYGLFGNKYSYFDKYIPVEYTSTVIFSRSNKTRESYTFDYDLEEVNYSQVSVSVKGNINIEGVVKIKKVDVKGKGDLSVTYDEENYNKVTESGSLKIVVHPNKKMTLRIVGEARITNGVSKYYFMGICFKKGAFEIVEIKSTIYELIEEDA